MSLPAQPPPDDWRLSSSSCSSTEEVEQAPPRQPSTDPLAPYAQRLEAILLDIDRAVADLPPGVLRYHATWHPFFHRLISRGLCAPVVRVLSECSADTARAQLPLFFAPTSAVRRLVVRERPGDSAPPPPARWHAGVYRGWLTAVRPPRTAAYAAQWKRTWEEVFDYLFSRHPGVDHPRLQVLASGKPGPSRRGGRVVYLPLETPDDDDDDQDQRSSPQQPPQ